MHWRTLARVPDTRCMASSSPPEKNAHALQVSGLAKHLAGNVFSSYDIGSWKPEPGLFLRPDQSARNLCLKSRPPHPDIGRLAVYIPEGGPLLIFEKIISAAY